MFKAHDIYVKGTYDLNTCGKKNFSSKKMFDRIHA